MSVTPRLPQAEFYQLAPAARDALIALGKAVDESGLEKELTELIKLLSGSPPSYESAVTLLDS